MATLTPPTWLPLPVAWMEELGQHVILKYMNIYSYNYYVEIPALGIKLKTPVVLTQELLTALVLEQVLK